jgi:stage V sporulation protein AC
MKKLSSMTNQEYSDYVDRLAPKSPIVKDCIWAFVVGGLICVLGQLLLDGYQSLGLGEKEAGLAVSISLVFLSALATGLNVYDDLAKHAGAGTLVPITGFANSVVSPAMEFKAEGIVTGMAAKMFVIAGPVIVFGTTASVVYGVIYWVFTLF